MSLSRAFRAAITAIAFGLLPGAVAACAETDDGAQGGGSDLTSVTARSRTLEFAGKVYLDPTAQDALVLDTVRKQAQTAFGPLRVSEMAVKSRELREVDPSTFVKRNVKVVDTSNGTSVDKIEVSYTYKDEAVVAVKYANRSTAPLALMNPNYRAYIDRVMRECTPNDAEAREFMVDAWYVFDPTLDKCQTAIRTEQEKIDADRAKLQDPDNQVTRSEVDRLYIPITAQLGADKTNRGDSYPDYQRLYSGGVQKDKLVVSLVFGMIDHGDDNAPPSKDTNWKELMDLLGLVMDAQGEFAVVPGPDQVDLGHFQLPSGRVVDSPKFSDLVGLKYGNSALGLSAADSSAMQADFARRIYKKWVAIEKPIRVSVGGEAPRDFAIQFLVYYGAGMSSAPHKYATKNSDVFIYNGHSSIGYGPLDPRNFSTADFPPSYQLFWMDGCVSYNYYNKDYLPLKEGGTKNLDLVTNGIEANAYSSGSANGKFLVSLLGGAKASYRDLLLAAKSTEALRVVDGELDNEFDPNSARTKVVITDR
jgi:hypothetical protein